MRRHVVSFGICLLASYATLTAHARSYPSKPVKIIVQTPVGNGPDVVLRIIADRLGEIWQQQPVIINRPGAGDFLAAHHAVAADPTATRCLTCSPRRSWSCRSRKIFRSI